MRTRLYATTMLTSVATLFGISGAIAADFSASSESELRVAMGAAGSGDRILLTGDITLSAALPPVHADLTIDGQGHTIDGSGQGRIFFVQSGDVQLQNMTLANGLAKGGDGGNDAGGGMGAGAAVFVNSGTTTVSNVTFAGNGAQGGTGGGPDLNGRGYGGGGGGLGGDGGNRGDSNGGGGGYSGGGGGGGGWSSAIPGGNGGTGADGGNGGSGGGNGTPGEPGSPGDFVLDGGGAGGSGYDGSGNGGPAGGGGGGGGLGGGDGGDAAGNPLSISDSSGGGGGGGGGLLAGSGGDGGDPYVSNAQNGFFGGGGGGAGYNGGDGGDGGDFGGGGGSHDGSGGNGGFGGGGGSARIGTSGAGGFGGGGADGQSGGVAGGAGGFTGSFGAGGGGGAALGGAIFVRSGATLRMADGSFSGSSLIAGSGGTHVVGGTPYQGGEGAAAGSDLFLMAGTTTVLIPAGTLTFNGTIADDGANSLPSGSGYTAGSGPGAALTIGDGTSAGTVIFNGANTYSGGTSLESGTLRVNNTSGSGTGAGAVAVNGGILGGSGTIAGDLTINSGGTLAPGNSIGTLHVGGNVTFEAGSSYAVEVNPAGASDLLDAGGTVTINGGIVHVNAAPGRYAPQDYTIIQAGTPIIGAFDDVDSNFAYLVPSLSYAGDQVILHLDVSLQPAGATPNQQETEAAVLDLGPGNPVFDTLIGLGVDDARTALDSLSGEIYASLQSVFVEESGIVRGAIVGRLAGDEGSAGPGRALWGTLYGQRLDLGGDGNTADLAANSSGLIVGLDGLVNDWRLGVLVNAGVTHANVADRSSSAEATNVGLGIYGGADLGGFKLTFGAAHSLHQVNVDRQVALVGIDGNSSDYMAATTQAFAEFGHELDLGTSVLEPFAQLAVVHTSAGTIEESGGTAALTSEPSDFDATFLALGLRGSTSIVLGDGLEAEVKGALGYRHAFGDDPVVRNSFAVGDAFSIIGVGPIEDALILQAGIDLTLGNSTSLDLTYAGQLGADAAAHSVKATLRAEF